MSALPALEERDYGGQCVLCVIAFRTDLNGTACFHGQGHDFKNRRRIRALISPGNFNPGVKLAGSTGDTRTRPRMNTHAIGDGNRLPDHRLAGLNDKAVWIAGYNCFARSTRARNSGKRSW